MRRRLAILILAGSVAAGCGATGKPAAAGDAAGLTRLFEHVGDIPLGPAMSRTDYLSLDATTGRLYIAGMGAGQLIVFDTGAGRLLRRLDGFPKVTGVLAVPALKRIYASVPGAGLIPSIEQGLGMVGLSSGRGAIAILDGGDLHQVARLPAGVFPDGIAFDPADDRIFVSDELGRGVTAIDAANDRVLGRVALGGEVGNVQYDAATGRVYAPVQSRNALATIDPSALSLLQRRPLAGCRHPHGLAIAPEGAIGYVACDENDRLLAIQLASGQVLADQPVAHDPDVLAIDATARKLYVAGESGRLTRFDIAAPGAPEREGEVFAGKGAHALAVDPATHRLYLPLADRGGRAVLRILAPRR